ncbi:hypothetical protein LY76DRAFT_593385 [Colletotrichum caudatum]|nr:hypothetical protein LY76DRAFT_593385 [Colletotrichum caudatum]
MRSQSLLVAALAASVSAHGTLLSIEGSNGVAMPGLTSKPSTLYIHGSGKRKEKTVIGC